MNNNSLLHVLFVGQLKRNYIITPNGISCVDLPGGSLLFSAVGFAVWESGAGLVGKVGRDYPHKWLEILTRRGLDIRGIQILPQNLDLRAFIAYSDSETCHFNNPISHYARLGLQFPKTLLGYLNSSSQVNNSIKASSQTIRLNDFPDDYLDAITAHLCPLDFQTHNHLTLALQQSHITTLTLDPSWDYIKTSSWSDIPNIFKNINVLLISEEKIRSLFQEHSTDLWEMAASIANYGPELVIIKLKSRGQYVYDHNSNNRWSIPAYPAQVVDPTGAGDAFCGGFLAGYRATYHPMEAALYGNISASLVIEGSDPFYALDALPGLAQARFDFLRDLVRKV